MPPLQAAFIVFSRTLLVSLLLALLVGDAAAGLACGLAGSLAFAAAAIFRALTEIAGVQRLNMLHLKDEGNEQLSNIDSYIFQAKDFCHYTFSICMKDKSKNFIQQMLDVLKDMTSGAGMNR